MGYNGKGGKWKSQDSKGGVAVDILIVKTVCCLANFSVDLVKLTELLRLGATKVTDEIFSRILCKIHQCSRNMMKQMQKRTRKMIRGMESLSYKRRLKKLGLFRLTK